MSPAPFDQVAYNGTTTAQWQIPAEPWHRWTPTLEAWLGPATEIMLDMAGVGPTARVLDVAAGAGGQTLPGAPAGGARAPGARRSRRPGASGPTVMYWPPTSRATSSPSLSAAYAKPGCATSRPECS